MFKKAYRYDHSIVFYFDGKDCKYVAKGGSLAWRLNNPGLISSHNLFAREFSAIGSCDQYAIFPSPLIGKNAHRTWIISSKYCDSYLIEIAKHYQPKNPEEYLSQLCNITKLSPKIKPRNLSASNLDLLLSAMYQLAGFTKKNEGEFYPLPKITARLYSRQRSIEFYLAGYNHLLTKHQALEWVITHKLDAVIVHKSNGDVYLRSRPGHHLDKIHIAQKDYGAEKEFKDAVKEVGKFKERQCIWGFINGLFNTPKKALESATLISNLAGGEHVWYLVNDSLSSCTDAIAQKLGQHSESVKFGIQFFKMLISLSDEHPSQNKPQIIIFAHSQGALIADLALGQLEPQERQRIRIFTIGGASLISPDAAHPESHNYFSIADLITKLSSYDLCRFLLRIHDGKKTGLSTMQIIEQLIQEDIDIHLETQNQLAIDIFRRQRLEHYELKLQKSQNITILNNATIDIWEHAFKTPSYQEKLSEIINKYRNP
jgi:hypothetical protein